MSWGEDYMKRYRRDKLLEKIVVGAIVVSVCTFMLSCAYYIVMQA